MGGVGQNIATLRRQVCEFSISFINFHTIMKRTNFHIYGQYLRMENLILVGHCGMCGGGLTPSRVCFWGVCFRIP